MESGNFAHPVEAIQKNHAHNSARLRNHVLSMTYGSHFVDALHMERQALAGMRRGAGLNSSMMALEVSMGSIDKIGFEDYMNLPHHREKIVNVSVEMEKRYDEMGMWFMHIYLLDVVYIGVCDAVSSILRMHAGIVLRRGVDPNASE